MQMPTSPQAKFSSPKRKRHGALEGLMTGNFQPANGVTFADEADNSGELDLSASPETNLYGEFVYKAQDKTVKNRGGNLCGLFSPAPSKINTTAATTEPTPMDSSMDLSTISPTSSPPSFINDNRTHDFADEDEVHNGEVNRTTRALFQEDGESDGTLTVNSSASPHISPDSEARSAYVGMKSLSIQRGREGYDLANRCYFSDASDLSSASPPKYMKKNSGDNGRDRRQNSSGGRYLEEKDPEYSRSPFVPKNCSTLIDDSSQPFPTSISGYNGIAVDFPLENSSSSRHFAANLFAQGKFELMRRQEQSRGRTGYPEESNFEDDATFEFRDVSYSSDLSGERAKKSYAAINKSDSIERSHRSNQSASSNSIWVLPDQTAFDTSRRSTGRGSPQSASKCPPTPQRTPNYFEPEEIVHGLPPVGLHRQNSLAASKILFTQSDNPADESNEVSFSRDFENDGHIGSGAFSDVFLVREIVGEKKTYAVKKSRQRFKSRGDRDNYMNEVKVMERLGACEYVIQLVRAWQESGYFYVQIEFAERGTLKDLMGLVSEKGNCFSDLTVWRIAHDIARGLDHIHKCGFVHVDIKPANILISGNGILKIGDFGMAVEQGVDIINEGDIKYMAPELLCLPKLYPSADMFSLSLSLYEICLVPGLSALPAQGEKWTDLREDRATPVNGRDTSLTNMISALMSKFPEARPTAKDILAYPILKSLPPVDETIMSAKIRLQPNGLHRSTSFRPIMNITVPGINDQGFDIREFVTTPTGDGSSFFRAPGGNLSLSGLSSTGVSFSSTTVLTPGVFTPKEAMAIYNAAAIATSSASFQSAAEIEKNHEI